jgi:hypothetical protein
MNRALLASGAIAALVGVVAIIESEVIEGLSLPSLFTTIIGLLALVEAFRAGYSRFSRSIDTPDVPEPERRQVASVPGVDFDSRLTDATSVRGSGIRNRERVRDRLTETAVEILVRYDGDTPEQARERLQTGSWTDDPPAAAFFAPMGEIRPSLVERIRVTITSGSGFRWRARRAIAALAAHEESDE